eukprot:10848332-Alexandrium_andersonii.AAC.1
MCIRDSGTTVHGRHQARAEEAARHRQDRLQCKASGDTTIGTTGYGVSPLLTLSLIHISEPTRLALI